MTYLHCNLVTYQPTHGPILYGQKYVLCVFLCFCSGAVFRVLVLSLVPIMRNCTSTAYNNNVLDNSVCPVCCVMFGEGLFLFKHISTCSCSNMIRAEIFFFFFCKKGFWSLLCKDFTVLYRPLPSPPPLVCWDLSQVLLTKHIPQPH